MVAWRWVRRRVERGTEDAYQFTSPEKHVCPPVPEVTPPAICKKSILGQISNTMAAYRGR